MTHIVLYIYLYEEQRNLTFEKNRLLKYIGIYNLFNQFFSRYHDLNYKYLVLHTIFQPTVTRE